MKNLINLALTCIMLVSLAACSDSDNDGEEIKKGIVLLDGTSTTQTIYADETSGTEGSIKFSTTDSWEAVVNEITPKSASSNTVSWLSLSQYSGSKAGNYALTITLETNFTGKDRKAEINITSGGVLVPIIVEQKGTTKDGQVPEKPQEGKLIIKITENAEFESDYYGGEHISWGEKPVILQYKPNSYEFTYDDANRVTAYIIRKHDGSLNEKYTYSYDTDEKIIVTNEDDKYEATLNEEGYISLLKNRRYNNEEQQFTYNNGYLSKISTPEGHTSFKWENGNLTSAIGYNDEDGEYEDFTTTFSTDLNNKANLDLSVFFFGIESSDYVFKDTNDYILDLFAMFDYVGKRSKNFITSKQYEADDYEIYTQKEILKREIPSKGIVEIEQYLDFDGDGKYSFDKEGYPTSYSHMVKVSKTVYTYNGIWNYAGGDEELEDGDRKVIITLNNKHTTVQDIYTYTIEYNK